MLRVLLVTLPVYWGCGSEELGGGGAGGGGGLPAASSVDGATSTGDGETGQSQSPCGVLDSPPEFAIGTGEVCYEPLRDGQIVPHITGPQGGYHVWGAVVCPGCPRQVIATIGAEFADTGEPVSEFGVRVIELKGAQHAGLIAYLTGTTADPASLLPEGTLLDIVIELTTLAGAPLHAGRKRVELGEVQVWLNQCDPDPLTCGQPNGKKCCS